MNQPGHVFEMILDAAPEGKNIASASPTRRGVPADWHEKSQEGQLAVDVAQTRGEVVIVSTMAGALPDRIELFIHNDLLTIRGSRSSPLAADDSAEYFYRECFWGTFSRTIVLPVDVKGELARAEYDKGVLVVRVPKRHTGARIPITVVDE